MSVAVSNNIRELEVYGDSNLVVQQMNKKWRVKSENLKNLFNKCTKLLENFDNISFTHILRKHNKRADELANKSLDG